LFIFSHRDHTRTFRFWRKCKSWSS